VDLLIADSGNQRIQMVAAGTTTPYKSGTTADDIYTIAGSATGSSGHTGDGAQLPQPSRNPEGISTGYGNNNLYIADSANNRVQEVPAAGGTQWVVSMTAGRYLHRRRQRLCTSGHTGRRRGHLRHLYQPGGVRSELRAHCSSPTL